MKELTVPALADRIDEVTAFVDAVLDENGCSRKHRVQIDVAIDELFSNIARYAYGSGSGTVTLRVEILQEADAVRITFIDHGVPYNPLAKTDPDITLSADEREIGGLGIFLVKRTMDAMVYAHEDEKNILTIQKALR